MNSRSAYFLLGGLALSGIAALVACITEHVRPVVEAGTSGSSCDGGGAGGFPDPMCEPSDNSCPHGAGSACATCGQCSIDKAKCGDPGTCLPMADNSAKTVFDFRLRRLFITAPDPQLTGAVIQGTTGVVTQGVDLAAPQCGDIGKGAFNWLLRVDPGTSTVTTGGAPPSSDPFSLGYCFYRHQLGNLDIEPSKVSATFDGGTFTTSPIALLNVPIFLTPDGGAGDPNNVIILPLRNAVLKQASMTNGNNCIGSFNALALDNTCAINDPSSCSKWHTAGSLGAAMTLEDADRVPLSILPRTLCVLLTGAAGNTNDAGITTCARDGQGNIMAKGDYCSTTSQPGGCQDSFWLSATFAAAAVTINDGSSVPTCQGGGSDAGTDASDASLD